MFNAVLIQLVSLHRVSAICSHKQTGYILIHSIYIDMVRAYLEVKMNYCCVPLYAVP